MNTNNPSNFDGNLFGFGPENNPNLPLDNHQFTLYNGWQENTGNHAGNYGDNQAVSLDAGFVHPERLSQKKLRQAKDHTHQEERDLTATISILRRDPEFDKLWTPAYTFTPLALQSYDAMKLHPELSQELNYPPMVIGDRDSQLQTKSHHKQLLYSLSKYLYIVKTSNQPASLYFRYRVDRPWWVKIAFHADFKSSTIDEQEQWGSADFPDEIELTSISMHPAFDEERDWNVYQLVERLEGEADNKKSPPEQILNHVMQFALVGLFKWSGTLMADIVNALKFTEFFDEAHRSCVISKVSSYSEVKELFQLLKDYDRDALWRMFPIWLRNLSCLSPRDITKCGFDVFLAYPARTARKSIWKGLQPPGVKPIGWAILGPICEPEFTERELESENDFERIETMSFRPLLSIGVLPDFRKQKIGTQLLHRCLHVTKESLHVYVLEQKLAVLGFFKKSYGTYMEYMKYLHHHTANQQIKRFFAKCDIHQHLACHVKSMPLKTRDRHFYTSKVSLLLSNKQFVASYEAQDEQAVKTVQMLEQYVTSESHESVSFIKVPGIPQRQPTREEAKTTMYRMKCLTLSGFLG